MKNILFATSEAVPFIKTGGLADVAGSLPKYFDKRYFDIRVILPKYACMKQEWKDKMNYITHFYMDLGYKNCYVDRILYTVMTGRPDLFPYICTTASSRMNFSGISRRS